MRAMCLCVVWVGVGGLVMAADPAGGKRVGEWKWSAQAAADLPGKVVDDARLGKVLLVERTEAVPQTARLANWKSPGLKTAFYAVRGQVRYEGVEGTGYLEMWNEFGAENRFFTRTMGQQGPMRTVSGTSPWRAFYLPFNGTGAPGLPTALEVNLVLPGKGKVEISNMELLEFADVGAMWAGMGVPLGSVGPRAPSRWMVPAAVGVAAGVGGVTAVCWWARQRQARELRRMRARDAG
ncbi:MAG TPA: hypothetical protein PLU30_17640, partial [Verrucomicrobiae bacterium]|nr:hypothetical protein [Verrucomicrobiae bacterium]